MTAGGAGHPDIVIRNVLARTLDVPAVVQAVAVADGRITALGTDAEIAALAGPGTAVVDGGGGTLLPAVIDSHTHFHRAAIFRALYLDFDALGATTIGQIIDAVAARARTVPAGTWIEGDNLRDHRLVERRWPTRHELDAAAPDHPVVLRSLGKHLVCANSLALSIGGITRDTQDPVGGRLDRDADGEPNGVLHETAKLRLDSARRDTVVPHVPDAARLDAVHQGIRELLSVGVGTIHEIVTRPEEIRDFQRLRDEERLGVRVRYYVRGVEAQTKLDDLLALGLQSGFGDAWIQIAGIKISVDGSCESRNAALFEPYPGQGDNRGMIRVAQDELDDLVRRADEGGIQVAIHAIGPRAADMALTSYERAIGGRGNDRLRHRLEHMYVQGPKEHFERVRRLGLILSEQPALIHSSGDAWREIFGESGLERMMPLRMALDMGITVQANSDQPSTPMDPLIGMRGAVTRRSGTGQPVDPTQAVTVDEVVRMQTITSAFATFEEQVTGSLRVGKRADLRLLDRDPWAVDPLDLHQLCVRWTMIDGAIAWSDGGLVEDPGR